MGVRISWLMLARNSDFSREPAPPVRARLDQRLLRHVPVADVAQDAREEAVDARANPSPQDTLQREGLLRRDGPPSPGPS